MNGRGIPFLTCKLSEITGANPAIGPLKCELACFCFRFNKEQQGHVPDLLTKIKFALITTSRKHISKVKILKHIFSKVLWIR